MSLSLRTATPDDAAFLYELVTETMRAYSEASFGPWNEAEVRADIATWIDDRTLQIVICDGESAGALRVLRLEHENRLDQIFITPPHQRRGSGTALIRDVIEESKSGGKPLRLRVWRSNPAQRLYARLGFVIAEETEGRLFMEIA